MGNDVSCRSLLMEHGGNGVVGPWSQVYIWRVIDRRACRLSCLPVCGWVLVLGRKTLVRGSATMHGGEIREIREIDFKLGGYPTS